MNQIKSLRLLLLLSPIDIIVTFVTHTKVESAERSYAQLASVDKIAHMLSSLLIETYLVGAFFVSLLVYFRR